MSAIQIQGLRPLKGTVGIQGSKNAVLPMMAASLLADGVTVIRHVPEIEDVFSMMGILESLGCKCSLEKGVLTVDTQASSGHRIPEEYVGKMRSSCLRRLCHWKAAHRPASVRPEAAGGFLF